MATRAGTMGKSVVLLVFVTALGGVSSEWITGCLGSPVSLPPICTIQGKARCTWKFRKDNTGQSDVIYEGEMSNNLLPLVQNPMFKDRVAIMPNMSLQLKQVDSLDAGVYEMEMTLNFKTTNCATYSLSITEPLNPPSVHIFPSSISVGEDVSMECIVKPGRDGVTVTWLRDGCPLIGAPVAHSLCLAHITAAHRGRYGCVASNACGDKYSKAVTLDFPYGPERVSLRVDSFSCRMSKDTAIPDEVCYDLLSALRVISTFGKVFDAVQEFRQGSFLSNTLEKMRNFTHRDIVQTLEEDVTIGEDYNSTCGIFQDNPSPSQNHSTDREFLARYPALFAKFKVICSINASDSVHAGSLGGPCKTPFSSPVEWHMYGTLRSVADSEQLLGSFQKIYRNIYKWFRSVAPVSEEAGEPCHQVARGWHVRLACVAPSHPHSACVWSRDGRPFDNPAGVRGCQLTLPDFGESLNGIYECVATNAGTNLKGTASVSLCILENIVSNTTPNPEVLNVPINFTHMVFIGPIFLIVTVILVCKRKSKLKTIKQIYSQSSLNTGDEDDGEAEGNYEDPENPELVPCPLQVATARPPDAGDYEFATEPVIYAQISRDVSQENTHCLERAQFTDGAPFLNTVSLQALPAQGEGTTVYANTCNVILEELLWGPQRPHGEGDPRGAYGDKLGPCGESETRF